MLKQVALVASLALVGLASSGCRVAAPALEEVGGYSPCGGCTTKTQMIVRQQARSARNVEEFMDTYFLNYDIHDPYRGDYKVLDGRYCCAR
jgi:hypothetical protein